MEWSGAKKLIDAALELLEATPIDAVSYQDIAEKANVPLPSCYHFYSSKLELVREIAERKTEAFNDFCFAAIDPLQLQSWPDVVRIHTERAIEFHNSSYALSQIYLGGQTPPEIRLDKQLREKKIGLNLFAMISRYFRIPDLASSERIFFQTIEIGTLFLSLDFMEKGKLDDETARDATLAMVSYLRNFIPPVTEKIIA